MLVNKKRKRKIFKSMDFTDILNESERKNLEVISSGRSFESFNDCAKFGQELPQKHKLRP